ncbi:MAG TPA: hypothetical protein VGN42_21340 [Pirellulales bacterium]|jgi:hypothetical protein|nr:hypothetical protein [Pirellulales bacterium]
MKFLDDSSRKYFAIRSGQAEIVMAAEQAHQTLNPNRKHVPSSIQRASAAATRQAGFKSHDRAVRIAASVANKTFFVMAASCYTPMSAGSA